MPFFSWITSSISCKILPSTLRASLEVSGLSFRGPASLPRHSAAFGAAFGAASCSHAAPPALAYPNPSSSLAAAGFACSFLSQGIVSKLSKQLFLLERPR